MSQEKKISAEELFKDYVPEVIEYDPEVDSGNDYLFENVKKSKKVKSVKIEAKVATQENKVSAEDLFKDYVAEVVEYDPEIDGGDEHLIRDDHLDKKEEIVLSVVEKLKNKQRATRGTRG